MQGSNVTTLVFVCVRVVTAGCDRAIRMHQDGLTLSPSSYIHRSPPSAFSLSFSSPPFLPFISFPTLCSSFHRCFVLFSPTYSYLLCCSISPHYSFLFLLCPCLLLTFLLCSTHPLSCYPPLFFSSAFYIYPPPPTVSVHAISSLIYSSFHLIPLHHHILLVSPPPLWRHPRSSGSSSKARIYILIYQFPAAVEAVMDGVLPAPQRCHELPW